MHEDVVGWPCMEGSANCSK